MEHASGVKIIKTKIADLEGCGSQSDGQFRPTKKVLFGTDNPNIFSVYTPPSAYGHGVHTLMEKTEIKENYSIFKVGTRFPIEI